MALLYSSVVIISVICFTNVSPTADDTQMARETYEKLMNTAAQNIPVGKLYENHVVDTALEQFFEALREQEIEQVKIPEIHENFSKKVGLVRANGSFRARNGVITGLTTIHRKGDANMKLDGTTILFDATLALDSLKLEMDYTAKLNPLSVSGKLGASVDRNEARCSGGLNFSSGVCRIILNSLELTELGQIDLRLTGLGPLNWIYSKIATSITSKLRNEIKETVVEQMQQMVENEMQGIICDPALIPQ